MENDQQPVLELGDIIAKMQVQQPPGKKMSERGSLIGFFAKELDRPSRDTAIRFAHFTLDELYAIKSGYADRLTRDGSLTAIKYLWWVSKTEKLSPAENPDE